MATNTTNYNLIKPAPEDFYNIAEFNINMDKIDSTLKDKADLENNKVKESQLPDGIAEHLSKTVSDSNGAHGLRYVGNDTLERYDEPTDTWIPIAVGAPKLQKLIITTPPIKTSYRAGETFVADGMVVTANYSQSAFAQVTGYKITPSGPLTAADKYITVAYTENGITKTVQQQITVAVLSSISVTTPPTKTTYVYGDYFNTAGMVVRATFSDGSTENVTTKITFSPTSALMLSNTSITISYTENGITKTTTQAITVTRRLTSIAIITPPSKTAYTEGETFSASGLVLRGYYNDGTYGNVTGYTYSPGRVLTTADTMVTITYSEGGVIMSATQAITVKPKVSNVLNDNDWATIAQAAEAGKAPDYWSIGDEKNITLTTGETLTLQIYDFDHDDLVGSGKAGITFGLKNLMASTRQMNTTNTNSGGFTGSAMYTWLTGTLWNSLPADLRAVIKTVQKKTSAGGQSTAINTDSMTVFLFSEAELQSTRASSIGNEGAQYPIFTNTASTKKYLANGAGQNEWWWQRSPAAWSDTTFCSITNNGGSYNTPSQKLATTLMGVCFGFCV